MTRIACDSVRLLADPQAADVAFFYVNGSYAQKPSDVAARFPGKVTLGIDVLGTAPQAAVRDWETGDKGGNLEQWVIGHNKASGAKDACVYCNRSTVAEVRQLTGTQVLGVDYWLIVATLDGTLVTGPGIVGCQVVTTGPAATGQYDLSVIWDDGWHPSPSPIAHLKADILQGLAAADAAADAVKAAVAQVGGHVQQLPA